MAYFDVASNIYQALLRAPLEPPARYPAVKLYPRYTDTGTTGSPRYYDTASDTQSSVIQRAWQIERAEAGAGTGAAAEGSSGGDGIGNGDSAAHRPRRWGHGASGAGAAAGTGATAEAVVARAVEAVAAGPGPGQVSPMDVRFMPVESPTRKIAAAAVAARMQLQHQHQRNTQLASPTPARAPPPPPISPAAKSSPFPAGASAGHGSAPSWRQTTPVRREPASTLPPTPATPPVLTDILNFARSGKTEAEAEAEAGGMAEAEAAAAEAEGMAEAEAEAAAAEAEAAAAEAEASAAEGMAEQEEVACRDIERREGGRGGGGGGYEGGGRGRELHHEKQIRGGSPTGRGDVASWRSTPFGGASFAASATSSSSSSSVSPLPPPPSPRLLAASSAAAFSAASARRGTPARARPGGCGNFAAQRSLSTPAAAAAGANYVIPCLSQSPAHGGSGSQLNAGSSPRTPSAFATTATADANVTNRDTRGSPKTTSVENGGPRTSPKTPSASTTSAVASADITDGENREPREPKGNNTTNSAAVEAMALRAEVAARR